MERASLADAIRVNDGIVLVAMAEPVEKHGELQLANPPYPDIGVVLASGCVDVSPDDIVLLWPDSGKYIENFKIGEHTFSLVRFLGRESEGGECVRVEISEHVLARLEEEMIKPIGNKVLVRRNPAAKESESGILLPDGSMARDGVSEVLEVGSRVSKWQPGMRVVCQAGGFVSVDWPDQYLKHYGIEKSADLAILDEDDILCELK